MNLPFINDFEYSLREKKKCRTNTVWDYMIVLKHIISIARNTGLLPFNPFAGYINSPESVDRDYLTEEEIQTLIEAPMKNKTDELVRDLFIFSVFTGLSYADVKNLTTDHLQTFFDGNPWIITCRRETNTDSNIRLLDVPKRIIEKYKGLSGNDHVFPMPNNSCYNEKLKKRQAMRYQDTADLPRRTTFGDDHYFVIAWRTHRNRKSDSRTYEIKTTQIYVRITNQKISQDMKTLSHKLEDMEKSICYAI